MNEEVERNGYDIPYLEHELHQTTFRDLLTVIGEIFAQPLNEQSPRWNGQTNLPLYMHQRALVAEMLEREQSFRTGRTLGADTYFSRYAFLGDREATGKSWTTVAYILACKAAAAAPQTYLQQRSQVNFYSTRTIEHQNQTNLIIVPNTHIHQWADLLEQTDGLNYLIVRRNSVIQSEDLVERIRNNDCVLVPNTLYSALSRRLEEVNFEWTRCFIDDWSSIQISSVQVVQHRRQFIRLPAQFTWILTHDWFPFLFSTVRMDNWYMFAFIDNLPAETPPAIRAFFERQKSASSLPPPSRSLLSDFINNHPARSQLVVTCDDTFIKESIAIQSPTQTIISYCGDPLVRILVALFSQRLGATLIAGDYVRALEMVGAQFVSRREDVAVSRPVDFEEACPICFEERLQIPTITNCCNKAFCARCLFQACQTSVSSRCPCCRGTLNGQRLVAVAERVVPTQQPQHPHKLDALVQAIRARPNGRHLIFFPLEQMYGSLRLALRAAELNFECLSGSRQVMQRKLERFSQGATDILILTNRQHILTVRTLPSVSSIFIYPDNIGETDKNRLLARVQCIGRTEQLEFVQFRETGGQQIEA